VLLASIHFISPDRRLLMPTAKEILSHKGFSVHVVAASASVLDAVERMNQLRIGALVVMEEGQVQGMFTERDVLRRVMGEGRDPAKTPVGEVMTTDVICCQPSSDLDEISAIMKDRRVRHLPVCDDDGDLLGLISIGDVNAFHASHQEAQITYLNEYLYGRV
jgi:CBS domain-containing protein